MNERFNLVGLKDLLFSRLKAGAHAKTYEIVAVTSGHVNSVGNAETKCHPQPVETLHEVPSG